MKKNYEEKIKELEKRIEVLESKPDMTKPFQPTQPSLPSSPPYMPAFWPQFCWCGRNYPHTCTWC